MKINGTIFEIVAKRNGDIYSNITDPSSEMKSLEDSDKYYGSCVLKVLRKHNVKPNDGLLFLIRQIARDKMYNTDELANNRFCYGVTWNFASVVTSENTYDTVKQYMSAIEEANPTLDKKFFEENESKMFVHNVSKTNDANVASTDNNDEAGQMDVDGVKNAIKNMIKFFSEFDFEPNFRFLNTLSNVGKNGIGMAKKYIMNYFKLIDSPYLNDVSEKMKSAEFNDIINVICDKRNITNKVINNRFELYYGSQGTGKTTAAMKKANGKVIVCHNDMNPSDLMEDFSFDDGKANFHPSALCKAMENGDIIVLDEINLLPFGSLRFLQGILDGKESIIFKGHEINIKNGFKIIGTMNLSVNGMTYALPSPIVDRCEYIEEYKLSENQLINAIA